MRFIIPKQIKVAGNVYDVDPQYEFKERSDQGGQSQHERMKILIAHLTQGGAPRSPQGIEQTLWHEIVHCIDYAFNAGKLEEDVVERLSQGLYQVLKDNELLQP